ncbi:MAG: hypothetical protein ACRDOI_14015 [Trebonia sp.]
MIELGVFTFADLAGSASPRERIRDLVDYGAYADETGLDVFGVGDHPGRRHPGRRRYLAPRRHPLPLPAAGLLIWASARRLAGQVTVPALPRSELTGFITEDSRWQPLSRCLRDPGIPLDVRAAGALLLNRWRRLTPSPGSGCRTSCSSCGNGTPRAWSS